MAVLKNLDGLMAFDCPGCMKRHYVNTKTEDGPPTWSYNGDMDKPTFSPSVNVVQYWGPERVKRVCHSFINNGMIRYLPDCTHDLSGKTVRLPDIL